MCNHWRPNHTNEESIDMTKKILPTPEQLRELLTYDPETGKLFWKPRPVEMFRDTPQRVAGHSCAIWNARYAGREAFTCLNDKGYLHGRIFGRDVLAHRAAFALHTGQWPDQWVDHENGIKTDNRATNIRAATPSQNNSNRAYGHNTPGGMKGAYLSGRTNMWRSYIGIDGRQKFLGLFATADLAHAAYCEAAKKYHGEFARAK